MYKIYTVNADSTVGYAAQELKKYLRMMMPRCGEIKVAYDPAAKEGFKLGLMSDFGLRSDVKDPYLDDEIYVKTDENGGVLAGNNPRSVLQAVYRYLKKNGCIWLFPGPDGECIPTVDSLKPVDYNHRPIYRYRGQCNEGAETQPQMMDAIEFTPKVGLNTFMIEHDKPHHYYNHFYKHTFDSYDDEGGIALDTCLQWKRACESEIEKRGMLFHDMGHGWTSNPFGFKDCRQMTEQQRDEEYKKDIYKHTAMIGGKRGLFGGYPLNTNLCMSNPKTRKKVADAVTDYAEHQNNVDFIHVWLADATNNHCECENCRKKTPSDWYIILLNEIDDALTKKGLDSHIVFIVYVDTFWAPITETIKNPKRFTMLFAPIKRYYTENYGATPDMSALTPYKCNDLTLPRGMAENLAYLKDWQKTWKGDTFCYEYYFWRAHFFDMGSLMLARTIYNDIKSLKNVDLCGIVADGSQRAFFPTGFCFYVYGEMLYDPSRTFEQLEEEYFSAAFGDDWRKVCDYLEKLSETSDFLFLAGHNSSDPERDGHYNPSLVPRFKKIPGIVDEFLPVIEKNLDTPKRCRYVSWNLLEWHAKFIKMYANAAALKANGEDVPAFEAFEEIVNTMAPLDLLRHDSYDHFAGMAAIRSIFKLRNNK